MACPVVSTVVGKISVGGDLGRPSSSRLTSLREGLTKVSPYGIYLQTKVGSYGICGVTVLGEGRVLGLVVGGGDQLAHEHLHLLLGGAQALLQRT